PDRDFLDVDLLAAPKEAPHLLILHGLEGSSRSGYVRACLKEARVRGWGAAAVNFRSRSGRPHRLLRPSTSRPTSDRRLVLRRLEERGAKGPRVAIGYSLGANVLLKMLAEDGDDSPLAGAVAVSTPYDLLRCARALDAGEGFVALYRWSFLRTLKAKA